MSLSVSACAAEVMLPSRSARVGLEAAQLRSQVLELLPGETRDVLLAEQGRAVALHTVELLSELLSDRGVGRVRLVGRWRRLLHGEIGREIAHVGIAEVRGHRRHLRVLAVTFAILE